MAAPRMSIDALAARLKLDRKNLCVVVEGYNDRGLVSNWADDENLPLSCYASDEIDIQISDEFQGLGGNKSRVLSVLSNATIVHFADRRILGIVDRDIDDVLEQSPTIIGVYYTDKACLISSVLSRRNIARLIKNTFHKDISGDILEDVFRASYWMFHLRVAKALLGVDRAPVNLKKYVRTQAKGGFDFDGYLDAVANSWSRSVDDIKAALATAEATDKI
ncbi:MAG: hypothetical protein EOP06_09840, partial [Proteobacteria bacterium]